MYLEKYMLEAYNLAELGVGHVSPNPLVGAVIVKNNQIVGMGYHRQAGTEHAEIIALNMAKDFAQDAELYVTLEPCSHYGRTPPCVDKIISSKIKKVYIGCIDPNPLVSGRGITILKNSGIEVEYGFCQNLLMEQNRYFFHWIKTGLPYINLKYAMTLDGRIATNLGESKWISNELAREKVQNIRGSVDGILVGINTILKDDPHLTYRLSPSNHEPYKIICDSNLKCPLEAKVIKHNPSKTIIATLVADENKIKKYTDLGVKIIQCKKYNNKLDLTDLCYKLGDLKIISLLVEGGSTLHGSFIDAQLFNRIYAFIAPKILGQGLPPLTTKNNLTMKEIKQLNNVKISTLGDNVLVQGDFLPTTNIKGENNSKCLLE